MGCVNTQHEITIKTPISRPTRSYDVHKRLTDYEGELQTTHACSGLGVQIKLKRDIFSALSDAFSVFLPFVILPTAPVRELRSEAAKVTDALEGRCVLPLVSAHVLSLSHETIFVVSLSLQPACAF